MKLKHTAISIYDLGPKKKNPQEKEVSELT